MEKARPKITNIYHHQIAELVKRFNRNKSKPVNAKKEPIFKSQEEYLAEARANLARSLDEARAAYIASGKPLLTFEEVAAEIAAIRGETATY